MYSFFVIATVLWAISCGVLCEKTRVRIAVLVPDNRSLPYSRERVLPGIELALRHIRKLSAAGEGPLPGVDLQLRYFDTGCDSVKAGLVSFKIHYLDLADVLFGPICSYAVAPVSRYATVWNIPIVTVDARSIAFDSKDVYQLLTRVNGAYSQLRMMVMSVLDKYSWKKVMFLFHEKKDKKSGHSECYFQLGPISLGLSKDDIGVETFDENNPYIDFISILHKVKAKSRSMYLPFLCWQSYSDSMSDFIISICWPLTPEDDTG